MADVKISGLPASTVPLAGTEVLPIVQGGVTKQVSIANVTAGRSVPALSVITPTIQAEAGSAGGTIKNGSGVAQMQWGSGGGSNLSLEVATNINPANAAVAISPTGTGTVTINPATAGTINNMVIGGTTPLAGNFTTINKMAITAPATSSTLAVANNKTFTANNSLTLAGTDATTMTFPSTSATIARTDAGQTFTGVNTFTSPKIITDISDTNGNEIFGITATASAVNELTIANAATGNNPIVSATGSDTNIGITLTPKGTGNAVLTSGNLVVANGNGIDFAATPDTGTSELFADYEEGTWTPVYNTSNGNLANFTNVFNTGSYTKVGRVVTVTANLATFMAASISGTGRIVITGLPYAPVAGGAGINFTALTSDNRFTNNPSFGQVVNGQTTVNLYKTNAMNTANALVVGDMNATDSTNFNLMSFCVTYPVA